MKFNQDKATHGHYHGLTDWLNVNVGRIDVDYWFVCNADRTGRIDHIDFKDPEKETFAVLRWGV